VGSCLIGIMCRRLLCSSLRRLATKCPKLCHGHRGASPNIRRATRSHAFGSPLPGECRSTNSPASRRITFHLSVGHRSRNRFVVGFTLWQTTHMDVVMARPIVLFESSLAVSIAIVGLAIGLTGSAQAAKTIYKCTKDGQVTLTDKACDGATSSGTSASSAEPQSGATTIPSSSNPSPIGGWHGQMQYQGQRSGQMLEEAHSVAPVSLNFTADGKVSGASAENGCQWLGVWSQGGRIVSVDMSLTGCKYAGLDRRFTGTFLLGIPDSSGEVMLQAFTIPFPGQAARGYDIKGTLRR
jgi:hypothetical protein